MPNNPSEYTRELCSDSSASPSKSGGAGKTATTCGEAVDIREDRSATTKRELGLQIFLDRLTEYNFSYVNSSKLIDIHYKNGTIDMHIVYNKNSHIWRNMFNAREYGGNYNELFRWLIKIRKYIFKPHNK